MSFDQKSVLPLSLGTLSSAHNNLLITEWIFRDGDITKGQPYGKPKKMKDNYVKDKILSLGRKERQGQQKRTTTVADREE